MAIIKETKEIWGKYYSTDSHIVEKDYDTFAETGNYNKTFSDWNYIGPETAAAIHRNFVPINSKIMDAACGSGLTGTALKNLGYKKIDGMDISGKLLKLAKKAKAYTKLYKIDMQIFPLPFKDNQYDSVNFIGALTYFETDQILRELCRITKKGGFLVFSQRDDIMRKKNYGAKLRRLEKLGLWKRTFSTDPMPYLPFHPQYGDKIKVRYFVYQILK